MYRRVCVLFSLLCSLVFLFAAFPARAQKVSATVNVGQYPVAIAVNPKTNKIYVANQWDQNVTVIDGATNSTTTVKAGNNPQAIAVNPVTNKIYVASKNDGLLTVIDGATNAATSITIMESGYEMQNVAVAVNKATNRIYVSDMAYLAVVDGNTNKQTGAIMNAGGDLIVVNEYTNQIFATTRGGNKLRVTDGATNTFKQFDTGIYPKALAVDQLANKVYIGHGGSSYVMVVDGATGTTAQVDTPSPDQTGFAVDPINKKVYVSNGGSMVIIDEATNATQVINPANNGTDLVDINAGIRKVYGANDGIDLFTETDGGTLASTSVSLPSRPYALAVNPVTNRVYVLNTDNNSVTVIDGAGTPVAPSNTKTVLKASANPVNLGTTITFTATVAGGAHVPSGGVTFKDGSTILCAAVLNTSGVATCSTWKLRPGAHTITAGYAGDTYNYGSASTALTETVNGTLSSTAISVSASPNPVDQNALVKLTATVTTSGTHVPTGNVAFFFDASGYPYPIGNGALNSSGMATVSSTQIPQGSQTITAKYAGDTFNDSSTANYTLTVNPPKYDTTTKITASPNPAQQGSAITFTITVTQTSGYYPTGAVNVKDGASIVAKPTLNSSGVATWSTSALALGTHSITADFPGDVNNKPSTSAALSVQVNAALSKTTTALTVTPKPAPLGATVTMTATVSTAGTHVPTGKMTFKDGTTVLGTGTLNTSRVATFNTSALALGTHSITAAYAGDAYNAASVSPAVSEAVKGVTSATLTSSLNPAMATQNVTFTVKLTTTGTHIPAGSVAFSDGTTALGTGTLNASGAATYTSSTLAVGTHSISAVFAGDTWNTRITKTLNQVITVWLDSTTASLTASPNPALVGKAVTFTATISTKGSHAPTGSVTFSDGSTALAKIALNAASAATYSTSALAVGSHPVTATYGGDAYNRSVKSNAVTEVIAASNNPVPTLTSISPTNVTAGGAAFNLTVIGSSFVKGAVVRWNGASRTTTVVSANQLTAAILASDIASAGSASITALNPAPGGGVSNALPFTIKAAQPSAAAPTISSKAAQGGAVIVSMSTTTAAATIFYTLDDSAPSTKSPIYQAPFLVESNTTVKAIAAATGLANSTVSTVPFTLNIPSGTLVWSDEFTDPTTAAYQPDKTVWTYDAGGGGWGNNELETYCAWNSSVSPCNATYPNAYVGADNALHIVARKSASGAYTSARMKSQGLLSFHYGRIEVRAKVPEGQGLWPAIWLLGNSINTAGWPACGEQDMVERVGKAGAPDWNVGSVHGTGFIGANLGTTFYFPTGQTAAGWHTYGMIWSKGSISYYIDDSTKPYATYTPASLGSINGAVWPFDDGNPAFLILNVAVGGSWPGNPDASTPFPSELVVDYVRVYSN